MVKKVKYLSFNLTSGLTVYFLFRLNVCLINLALCFCMRCVNIVISKSINKPHFFDKKIVSFVLQFSTN